MDLWVCVVVVAIGDGVITLSFRLSGCFIILPTHCSGDTLAILDTIAVASCGVGSIELTLCFCCVSSLGNKTKYSFAICKSSIESVKSSM